MAGVLRVFCALALTLAVAAAGLAAVALPAQAAGSVAAKKKKCKKTHTLRKGKCVKRKKRCKRTHRLRKGKCVRKPKAKPGPKAPTAPGPAPLSDADGDGIPYALETTKPAPPPAATPKRKKCSSKQRLVRGRCVKRCKKGRTLKRGKCVKKKRKKKSRKRAKSSALGGPASVAPLGANPNHKDIFVQINYANATLRQNASCAELDRIVAAFASAPVSNPDGRPGINLHIDAGKTCPSRNYNLGGSSIYNAGACPGTSETFNAVNLQESRAGTFHVAGFSPTCGGGGGEGGAATFLGTEMVVYTDGPSFAHVLMHELGHNLGLDHPFPGQPNRISSMNTRLQASNDGNGVYEVLDYQRFDLPALNENALSEQAGLSAPAAARRFYVLHWCASESTWRDEWPGNGSVDWNCNSPSILVPPQTPTIDPGLQSVDVNGDGQKTTFPATGNEWVKLSYRSGGGIGPR
jgi:hypothetical protein